MSANPVRVSMPDPIRGSFIFASLSAASGVMLSALSAHLPDRLFAVPGGRAMLHSAVEIQMWHALGLCVLSLNASRLSQKLIRLSCLSMAVGMVLFCLPVTLLALFNLKLGPMSVGRIAPYGGTMLMIAWCLAAASALRRPFQN
ncbi:DUF423 domain-containing protein [Gluconobacter sphaericus]|uniref:DUF423 domain-containing protein n=1 Tax=Gluconobacter sphaericus NBRC 12467 TaxID=1307951 RepID=A0AA37SI78_9PROT|nr:DUF423 domain-containing protein [Gluconobacter sphaericus]MBF0886290.1 DUF423 domain-containing protein [Gluconobacter sphaericus]MBS1086366.1 DUF423 domain-containing protein [Gluconobacter sphaericus]MBS1100364.1 DUF423 domain-containing protein [Gluconobacter sphaericus]GEB43060.1 hypothetical protein GSP01_18420 [Gluconobacter sphaericus NBRC 12467]GLQ85840.1 hypothetical protein GCM10007872_27500 [Gluconobacter sphaericus NBRC 12467]